MPEEVVVSDELARVVVPGVMLEREAELAALDAVFDAARGGEGRLVVSRGRRGLERRGCWVRRGSLHRPTASMFFLLAVASLRARSSSESFDSFSRRRSPLRPLMRGPSCLPALPS